MSKGHVIGLASLPGAGKEGIAQGLIKLGVEHLHIGTVVRSTARENGFVPKDDSREAYLPFWGEYAKEQGQDWLARLALKTADETGSTILLDGVRIPKDAEIISEANNGHMVWLGGNLDVLARRVVVRNRIEDEGITESEYVVKMKKDLAGEGHFPMGSVRDASELFLLPVPEIEDPAGRTAYYDQLARHVLDICGLTPTLAE